MLHVPYVVPQRRGPLLDEVLGFCLPSRKFVRREIAKARMRPHRVVVLPRWPVSSSKTGGWCEKRAKRRFVVTARSPLTMAPMRVAGTRKAIAKALTDIPSGLRNSSLSTSPGWAVTRLGVAMALVAVDDFDIGRCSARERH